MRLTQSIRLASLGARRVGYSCEHAQRDASDVPIPIQPHIDIVSM